MKILIKKIPDTSKVIETEEFNRLTNINFNAKMVEVMKTFEPSINTCFLFKSFNIFAGTADRICRWKSQGLLKESITTPDISDTYVTPKLTYIHNS